MTSKVPVNIAPGGRLFLDKQTRRLQAQGLLHHWFASMVCTSKRWRRQGREQQLRSSGTDPPGPGQQQNLVYFQVSQTAALAFWTS